MIDIKLVLVKAITLLFLEGQLEGNTERSYELCNNIISHIKLPETYNMPELGKDPVVHLRETLQTMTKAPEDHQFGKAELLQRLRVNVSEHSGLYDSLVTGFNITMSGDQQIIKDNIYSYRSVLRQFNNTTKMKDVIKNAYTQTWFKADEVDWKHCAADLIEQLMPFTAWDNTVTSKHPSIVNDVTFTDKEAVKNIFQKSVAELDTRGIIHFGHQGLNRMFGDSDGARRGEMIVIQALQHNFKSGLCLEMFKGAALYNTPQMKDEAKKPMLMRISFENSLENDFALLYRSLVENETGVYVDPRYIDPVAASIYVIDRLQATGYTINMCHIDPSEYTFRDLFDRIEQYEAMGYEIHMLNLDYLAMMSKKGCATGPAGVEFRDLYRRVRNFCLKRGITVITPHQLSTEAKMLTRAGMENFVQEVANKGYYDSCRTIDQEVDMEIVIHIVKINGEAYLTMQRGKHRKPMPTPEEFLYVVYKFEKVGTIPDDYGRQDMSRKSVGGKAAFQGGEPAWFHGM